MWTIETLADGHWSPLEETATNRPSAEAIARRVANETGNAARYREQGTTYSFTVLPR